MKRTASIHPASAKANKRNSISDRSRKIKGCCAWDWFWMFFIQQFRRKENIAESMWWWSFAVWCWNVKEISYFIRLNIRFLFFLVFYPLRKAFWWLSQQIFLINLKRKVKYS
jgi:hypothetical protein